MIAKILAFIGEYTAAITTVSGFGGGAFALWRYRADQHWKKLQFAYDYAEKMFDDPCIMTALNMIDWHTARFPAEVMTIYGLATDDGKWTHQEVCAALQPHDDATRQEHGYTIKDYAIRAMFDRFLAAMDRLGSFERQRVITAGNFPTALGYYAVILSEQRLKGLREAMFTYMETYRYADALALFRKLGKAR